MAWSDDLRRVRLDDGRVLIGASFRGVPFLVDSADRAGGRRTVTHEFPGKDDPYVEDLGRRARVFQVEGYVLGETYIAQRDALLAALEDTAGPGELVHPYHKVRPAVCSSVSVRDSVADGGLARFAIEFIEAPVQAFAATEQADWGDRVNASANAAIAATVAALEEVFSVVGLATWAVESAEVTVAAAADGMREALGPVIRATQDLARFNARLRLIRQRAASLARSPAETLESFVEVLDGLTATVEESPRAVLSGLVAASAVDLGAPVLVTTAARARERANQDALQAALRRLFAIEAARLATRVTFDSHEDATAARDELTELLDAQAEVADDTAYPALVKLRSDLVRAVPGDVVLARLVTIERRTAVPSLVLTYQLYGSVENEADVLARNHVRHPGVVSGELRVLSDV